jgi:hypothetical protein
MLFRIVDRILTEFKKLQPGVQTEYSKNDLSANGPTERVVWYIENDSYGPVKHLGSNPRQTFSREANVAFQIFSKTTENLDNYIEDVLSAAQLIMNEDGIIEASGETIDLGTEDQNGYGYKLNITLSTTVTNRMRTTGICITEVIASEFV